MKANSIANLTNWPMFYTFQKTLNSLLSINYSVQQSKPIFFKMDSSERLRQQTRAIYHCPIKARLVNVVHLDIQNKPLFRQACHGILTCLTAGVHTHLGFLTGLTVCAVWLVVQLLGDHTKELRLVFISVVIRGANADQLGWGERRERASTEIISFRDKMRTESGLQCT
jgi:hypothetical protein